ncbi:hypothetical protein Q1695_010750 [Nippostrongylus brasiliensis]|nr:hypothetical protein Q1695_010750 [Nippostrongylus brasiliensis]
MSAQGGQNGRGNNTKKNPVDRNNHARRPQIGRGGSATQGSSSRKQQLTREERGKNLQYTNVNMRKYDQMIGSAKDNFADIPQSGGAVDECTICCKTSDIFGLGSCRHPICIECAIRIRVLSNCTQCPVCRANMDTLWITFVNAGLETIELSFPSFDHHDEKRFGIRFENKDVVARYEKYLAHVCKLCRSSNGERLEFPTFVALRHHMSSAHELTYCHICTDNIILFSRERKTYTRDALQRHIRSGDRDDSSLKGHPSCLFCDQRFFDEEFRYRHLRKEHFFCQFCETEGKHMNVFFEGHAELVSHYKEHHFLCDFEECKTMGIAFSNQMDLKLHQSKEHGGRRAPVALDFQFSDRQLAGPSRTRREGPPPSAPNLPVARREKIALVQQEQAPQPTRPAEEFVVVPSAQSRRPVVRYNVAPAYTPQTEDFPTLNNSRPDPSLNNLRPDNFPRLAKVNNHGGTPHSVAAAKKSASGGGPSAGSLSSSSHAPQKPPTPVTEDFPALPVSRSQKPSVSAWANKKTTNSVIVGCKMPSKNKSLPQPDVWPERPRIASITPAREPAPDQWQEVPAKARKPEKNEKKTSKSQNSKDSKTQEQSKAREQPTQSVEGGVMESAIPVHAIASNGNSLPSIANGVSSTEIKSSTASVAQSTSSKNPDRSTVDGYLAEVEKFVEDSVQMTDDPTGENSRKSVLDWFTSSSSSLFSNLSLANVLGSKEPGQKPELTASLKSSDVKETVTKPNATTSSALEKPSSVSHLYGRLPVLDDAPPGFSVASVPADQLLLGPPPGFEVACSDGAPPPGLGPQSSSKPMFSMAPFISEVDLVQNNNVALGKAGSEDCEWTKVKGK